MSYLLLYLLEYWKAGHFPSTLYLQVDNSWKESKNKTIFATLAWLVQIGCFEEIQLHCLIQSHTHTDIDQVFSTIARAFWISCITTIGIFQQFVQKLFKRPTSTPTFTNVYNWTKFFDGIFFYFIYFFRIFIIFQKTYYCSIFLISKI
jgi:hypothetical protein